MSRFSDALRSALAELQWSQGDFVERTGVVKQATLSRYLADIDVPKSNTLNLICEHLPANIVRDVTAAYLTDQIPPAAASFVNVTVAQEGGESVVFTADKPFPGSLLEANLAKLGRYALHDPNLAIVIDYLVASKEGRPPVSDDSGENLEVFTVEEERRLAAARKEIAQQQKQAAKAQSKQKSVRYAKRKPGEQSPP